MSEYETPVFGNWPREIIFWNIAVKLSHLNFQLSSNFSIYWYALYPSHILGSFEIYYIVHFIYKDMIHTQGIAMQLPQSYHKH